MKNRIKNKEIPNGIELDLGIEEKVNQFFGVSKYIIFTIRI